MIFKVINIERDFDACMRAQRDAYQIGFGSMDGFDEFINGYQERMLARQDNPLFHYYHVWDKGSIIGQLEFHTRKEEGVGYVFLVYLIPECRGSGVAAELNNFICAKMREAGCRSIQLSVSRTNERAMRYYRKHGWRFLGENSQYKSTDFWVLELG